MSQLEKIYGVHAVEALLRHHPKRVKQIWLSEGRSEPRIQALLELASQLIQHDTAHPIGYRLRRYALWSGIETLPSHSAQQRTQLAAPDADRRHDYRQGLATPTVELWQQIEQSLTLSPFWLEGHWLSAQAAQRLGYPTIAHAIAQELRQLLQRLPGLEHLAFVDGTPLLSPEGAQWLHHSSSVISTPSEDQSLHADMASIEQALQLVIGKPARLRVGHPHQVLLLDARLVADQALGDAPILREDQ